MNLIPERSATMQNPSSFANLISSYSLPRIYLTATSLPFKYLWPQFFLRGAMAWPGLP